MRPWMPVYCAVALLLGGCAFFKSIGRTLAVAGGAGTGAVVGSAAGPVGTFVGGAAGGGIVYSAMENSELRSGSLQGSEARDAEMDRLKAMLINKEGEIRLNAADIGAAMLGKEWAVKWITRLAWTVGVLLLMWLMARSRYLRRSLTGEDAESRPWMLVHAIFGWDWTRRKAFGFDPLKEGLEKTK